MSHNLTTLEERSITLEGLELTVFKKASKPALMNFDPPRFGIKQGISFTTQGRRPLRLGAGLVLDIR